MKQLDRFLGETVVALDLIKKDQGLLIIDENVEKEKFDLIVKGTVVEKFIPVNPVANEIYEKLTLLKTPEIEQNRSCKLSIDAFFDVKSVGSVILGLVKKGKVSANDKLQLYPTKKLISVRSIQVHDEDVKQAGKGSRVGLALKDVSIDELERGMVLATPGSLQIENEISVSTSFSKYYTEKVETNRVFQISIGMQHQQGKVVGVADKGDKKLIKFQLQTPIAFEKNETVFLSDPGAKLRICGVGIIE